MHRALLFIGVALVILTLGAPQLHAQFFDACCKLTHMQCISCSVPPCDQAVCWFPCTGTARGYPGYRGIRYCCNVIAIGVWSYDTSRQCIVTASTQVAASVGIHIRPFYLRGCHGDYVLIDPAQKG
jgi:hypothetical protein